MNLEINFRETGFESYQTYAYTLAVKKNFTSAKYQYYTVYHTTLFFPQFVNTGSVRNGNSSTVLAIITMLVGFVHVFVSKIYLKQFGTFCYDIRRINITLLFLQP